MTDAEKEEHKKKMHNEMLEHLRVVINYPNCSNNEIMAQVPYMWNLLVAKKLTLPGMTYQEFLQIAHEKYMQAEVNRIIGI